MKPLGLNTKHSAPDKVVWYKKSIIWYGSQWSRSLWPHSWMCHCVMSLYMYIYIFLYIQNMTALVLNTKTFFPKQSCMKKNPLFDLVVKGLDHCDLILGCATVPCPYIYKYIYIYMQNMMDLRQISSGPASLYQKKNWRKFDISPFMKGRQLKIKLL
jgi:hypothetical protein